MRVLARLAVFGVLWLMGVNNGGAQFPPAPGTGPGLPETIEAIDSARVVTRILYITAHPDDESAAVLTYLARGVHADVALLSLTHGEGGQNALGPEQGPQLGLIRSQELLAATRGYGVKLYFTRALDFGFSKTPEETERIWGDQVIEDMVRIMREFRPNVVINNWGGVHGGHGHHQAAGILTPKAVQLAEDPSYKLTSGPVNADPEVAAWNPKGGILVLDLSRGDTSKGYALPLDEISPLYGKSWREIGLDAFVNHHTQGIAGFLNSSFLWRPIALVPENGGAFKPEELAQPLTSLGRGWGCQVFSEAQESLDAAREAVMKNDFSSGVQRLAAAANDVAHWMDKCGYHLSADPGQQQFVHDVARSRQRIERALALAAGLQLKAEADTGEWVAGDAFHVSARAACRKESQCALGSLTLKLPASMQEVSREGDGEKGFQFTIRVTGAPMAPPDEFPHFSGRDGLVALLPEPPALVTAQQEVTLAGYKMNYEEPVTHVESTSTSVVRVPLRVAPAYTLSVQPKQAIEVLSREHKPFDIFLRVHAYTAKPGPVTVGLDVPDGIRASAAVSLTFDGTSADQYAKFTVTPPAKLDAGNFTITAYAQRGGEKFTTSLSPLPSMPTILWSEPAQCVLHAFEINVPAKLRAGYISAEGEPIPDALRRLGITVEMLDAEALAFGDLSHYDAIVVGVRAYELRPELAGANRRLLEYVSNGGTLVVQYNRDYIWDKQQPAPYPAKIGNPTPRITDETSPVKLLKPDDRLLNEPNKIAQEDFKNWVQERGLYFWSTFDSRYTPLLAMNDPGEKDLNGGLVYARYGQGTYIYTGLAFFRELPEGVPGAYRLFVNLLSASRTR